MQKILFSDKYGLTKAVLEGRKTQTRRIIPGKYAELVEASSKATLVVPVEAIPDGLSIDEFAEQWAKQTGPQKLMFVKTCPEVKYIGPVDDLMKLSRYRMCEEVAVAQSYKAVFGKEYYMEGAKSSPGWRNKMFVRAELMPHLIRITDIRIQHLQDITNEDCLQEGIIPEVIEPETPGEQPFVTGFYYFDGANQVYETPFEAYAALIDKISGKGTWDSNPWVFAYTFKLIN